MPWAAKLTSLEVKGNMVCASLEFSCGGEKSFVETIHADDLTEDRIAVFVGAKIASLDACKASKAALEPRVGQTIAPITNAEYLKRIGKGI